MSSGGDQGWRGGRRRRGQEAREEAQPSWKRSRQQPTVGRKSRSYVRMMTPVAVLLLLVALAIYIFGGAKYVHTHFVVLDLITGSLDFDAADVPIFPENPQDRLSTRRVTSSRLQTLSIFDGEDTDASAASRRADMERAQAVVIYLQTLAIPAANGDFQCLIRNSTPDLDAAGSFESLQKLKASLQAFRKRNPKTGIVLVLDTPDIHDDWRLGFVDSGIFAELEKWREHLSPLVVMAGASDSSTFLTGTGPGTDGKTVFGHFVQNGFSRLADTDRNNELTVAEFCEYVSRQTDHWLAMNRGLRQSAVRVYPDLSTFQGAASGLNFVVMKDLPTLGDDSIKSTADPGTQRALAALWKKRSELFQIHAYRWHPLLWRAATTQLQRCEAAWLNGQSQNAERALQRSRDLLARLEKHSRKVCAEPGRLNVDRDLVADWFSDLPSRSWLAGLWEENNAPAADSGQLPTAERVLARYLDTETASVFPFSQSGLAPPAATLKEQILQRRTQAEASTAELFGIADRVGATVRAAERELLSQEDRIFVRTPPEDSAGVSGPTENRTEPSLYAALAAAGRSVSAGETMLCLVLETVPGLTRWCSIRQAADFAANDADAGVWQELLLQNSADVRMTAGLREQLLARLDSLNTTVDSDVHALSRRLQAAVFRMLIDARTLEAALQFAEPEGGFQLEILQQTADRIASLDRDLRTSLLKVQTELEQLCRQLLESEPQTREMLLGSFQLLRSTLETEQVPAETRSQVLAQLVRWDEKLKKPMESDQAMQPGTAAVAGDLRWRRALAVLWLCQSMNLLAGEPEADHSALPAWKAAVAIVREPTDGEEHDRLAGFARTVRSVWKDNRRFVRDSLLLTGRDAQLRLRLADQRSRLLPAFDAELEVNYLPMDKLLLLNKLHYCLLHVDRLLQSQWVDVHDQRPFATNGWYARMAQEWLRAADSTAAPLQAGSAVMAPVISQLLSDRRGQLTESEQLRIISSPRVTEVDLGDQNTSRRMTPVEFQLRNPGQLEGLASVLVLPAVPGGAAGALRVDNNGIPLALLDRPGAVEMQITRVGNPGGDNCQPVPMQTSVFFRGRSWPSEQIISVNPCAGAEYVTTRLARPATAAVQVSGADPRPIVFVLDWSGSMTAPLAGQPGTTRAEAALQTLEDLIRRPSLEGSQVSVKMFGHRIRYNSTTRSNEVNAPYREIFRKEIPDGLNALTDIETEFPMRKADAAGIQAFSRFLLNLRRLPPFGITPLASAITRALTDDLNRKAGIVIAVTDGEANDVGRAQNPGMQPENDRRKQQLIRALSAGAESKVVIVAFDLKAENPERQALQKVFVDECGIPVIDAADREQLTNRILESLDPRRYTVSRPEAVTTIEADLGQRVAELPPGADYRIVFGDMSTPANLQLSRGDDLRVRIDQQQQQLLFARDVESQMRAVATPSAGRDLPTMLRAAAPAKFVDTGSSGSIPTAQVELILMLDHEQRNLPVRQPAEIEFRLTPRGSDIRPGNIREQFNADYGAPAWLLTVDAWPREHDILVDAFWKDVPTVAEVVLPWEQLKSAGRPETDRRIGGDGSTLPEVLIRSSLLPDGTLQVRLDRVPGIPYADQNQPDDIRAQIGRRDERERNATFQADEITTTIRRTESGSVIYEFAGGLKEDSLLSREVAFTSMAARRDGSFQLSSPLLIDRRR